MRLRNIKGARDYIEKSDSLIKDPSLYKGKFKSLFKKNGEIHIEIGCGKGTFIYEMALNNPNINFIGIEKYESIILRAIEKYDKNPLDNLKFIVTDAKNLDNIFSKEISRIYLNFSDPWPKNRHAKRRLTSLEFLKVYDNIFKGKKEILQKTDNTILFASSIKSFNNYGYFIEDITLDLANHPIPNIETEYEKKFKEKGFKINYIKVTKK